VSNAYDANTALALNETVLSGYNFVSLTGDAKCPGVLGGTVTLDEGEHVSCTITNDDVAPTLTLTKVVTNNNGGNAAPNDFLLTVGGAGVSSGVSNAYDANTALALNETVLSGYNFVSLTGDAKCPAVLGGTVTLDEGENVSCTITNNDIAPQLIISKTPDGNVIVPGETATFTIVVTNVGGGDALGVDLDDVLPSPNGTLEALVWTETNDSCTITGGVTLHCDIGTLTLDPTPGTPATGDEDSFTVVVSTMIPADYLAPAGTPGGPGTLGSNFEVEGNLVQDGADPLLDWGSPGLPNFVNVVDQFTGQQDDSLGKGSKENSNPPTVVNGSIPKNKSDLTNFLVAADDVDGNNLLFLGFVRANTIGTANIDFELNQVSTPSANGVTPIRTIGDILILFDFASGGTNVELALREWDGSGWVNEIDLDAAGAAEGAVNDGFSVINPLGTPDPLADRTFGEAVINLTQIFGTDCRSFASAFVKSRSSTSFTASLKDLISPTEVDLNTCQSIPLPNEAFADALNNAEVSDTGSISVTNEPMP
jgi:uncharacterized repeat protein (TIGR01451 family)